jgi:fibronectin type 3 domain-containing protein
VLPRERGLEVLWTPSPEDDLAGYRVYREAPGEPRSRVVEVEAARSAWLDATARPGVVYQYDVTAFDRAGNESPQSPAVEASLP